MTGFVMSLLERIFDEEEASIMLLLKVSVGAEVVLVLVLMGFIFRSRREIFQLKREIFT